MSFLREHFPHLVDDYARRYATADFTDATYRREVTARVRAASRRHGLAPRSTDALLTRATAGDSPSSTPPRKAPQTVRTAGFEAPCEAAQGTLFAAG